MTEKYVGVSVSAGTIEASVRPTGEQWSAQDSDDGINELADRLRSIKPEVVVIAANGRRELPVAGGLVTAGLRCAFISPIQVREFARTIGKVSHLQHNQAQILAHFAELVRPKERALSKDQISQLRALRTRRREIVKMINTEQSRLHDTIPVVRKDLRLHIQYLEKSLQGLEEEFNHAVRSSPMWR